ncbi:magnesium and cobalt efflux protein CorC [bacterium BMS3Abin04]|nr:magnesium and cobalt efflux protein CorC [bacterium BMS3Abin04]
MTLEIIGLLFLLFLSGFFSSSELAFVVSNKIKIEISARKNNLAAKSSLYYLKNPQVFFSTILIANNIVNIAFASIITIFLFNIFQFNDIIILLISSTLILLFGELIPKYVAREFPDRLIMLTVLPVRVLTFLLYPFVKITSSISSFLTSLKNAEEESYVNTFEKDDIHSLIDESSKVGTVDEEESDIIKKIIDLGEQKIYQAMTPRTDIVGVGIDSSINDVISVFVESGYSKIPVYGESLDDIKGIVYAYDMFKLPENLTTVIREVKFVPETKKSLDMLNEFLDNHISIAIVVDEFGGTAGIITLEDIIEEMFGEIRDEYDVEEDVCKKIDDSTFIISGKVEIDYINEEFELNIPEGDYETFAGYIITKLGRIPVKNEKIKIDNFLINILHSTKTKINLAKLIVLPNSKGTNK